MSKDLGPVNLFKVAVTFRARKAILYLPWCIRDQNFNNFENDTTKLSVNEAIKLIDLSARNCAAIQEVLILKFASRPEKLPDLYWAFRRTDPWN